MVAVDCGCAAAAKPQLPAPVGTKLTAIGWGDLKEGEKKGSQLLKEVGHVVHMHCRHEI